MKKTLLIATASVIAFSAFPALSADEGNEGSMIGVLQQVDTRHGKATGTESQAAPREPALVTEYRNKNSGGSDQDGGAGGHDDSIGSGGSNNNGGGGDQNAGGGNADNSDGAAGGSTGGKSGSGKSSGGIGAIGGVGSAASNANASRSGSRKP